MCCSDGQICPFVAGFSHLESLRIDCSPLNWINTRIMPRHEVLRDHLGPTLSKLRHLVFASDHFNGALGERAHVHSVNAVCILYACLPQTRLATPPFLTRMLLQHHMRRMRIEAADYASAFPLLEFLHIGCHSFRINSIDKSIEILNDTPDTRPAQLDEFFKLS